MSEFSSQRFLVNRFFIGLFYVFLLFRFFGDSFGDSRINIFINIILLFSLFCLCFSYGSGISGGEARLVIAFFLIFLFYFFVGVTFSKKIDYAEFFRVVSLIIFGFMVFYLYRRSFFSGGLYGISFISAVFLFYGVYQVASGDYRIIEGMARLNGSYAHPNPYGMHLVMMFCFFGLFFVLEKKWTKPVFWIALFSLILFSQVMNFSAILAVFVFFGFLYIGLSDSRVVLFKIVGLFVFVFVVVGILYSFSSIFSARVDFVLDTGIFADEAYAVNSFHWRILNWSYYIHNIDDIYFGNGVGASDIFYKENHYTNFAVLAPHNEWLKVLFEYGLLGVMLFIYFIFFLFRRVTVYSQAMILAFIASCFFDNFFKSTSLVYLLVVLVVYIEANSKFFRIDNVGVKD